MHFMYMYILMKTSDRTHSHFCTHPNTNTHTPSHTVEHENFHFWVKSVCKSLANDDGMLAVRKEGQCRISIFVNNKCIRYFYHRPTLVKIKLKYSICVQNWNNYFISSFYWPLFIEYICQK